ncbi:TIGR02710 family CRISPR-associated CARF protein [Sutcliffiella horikoshii]|uniref:TIGR02710 family CRISPR-associated CARF protein n=1 Tax=Sutcliffiella horikoshii TaxID=79883 RepID=UPI001CFED137|nr:TIGR02710 family CRISPR-associated CARF protein [Sutcliffiella horikoshii]
MMRQHLSNYYEKLHENREVAREYYFQHLFDSVCFNFQKKVAEKQANREIQEYDYLIMTVGYNIEPLVMWIKALRPKRVFFLCSEDTEQYVDEICKRAELIHTQCDHEVIRKTNGTDVYEMINKFIEKNRIMQENKLNRVAIDITDGTKSMVTGCTLTANHLGMDLLYIHKEESGSGYLGKEEPMILQDPLVVFGQNEYKRGIAKFNSEDFEAAAEIFKAIKERVINPRKYEVLENLAVGYAHLESMRFDQAHDYIRKAVEWAERMELSEVPTDELRKQLKAIEPLMTLHDRSDREKLSNDQLYWHLYAYLFEMTKHYKSNNKHDITALLTYRCLEMTVQRLLLKHGIYTTNASFSHLDQKQLLKDYNVLGEQVFPNYRPLHYFPNKITLMSGMILLRALQEPMIRDIGLADMNNMITLRNKSRLVHGFELLTEEQVEGFYNRIKGLSNFVWNHDKHTLDSAVGFEEFSSAYSFVNISLRSRLVSV